MPGPGRKNKTKNNPSDESVHGEDETSGKAGNEDDKSFRISIKPPDAFDTKQPALWPRWFRIFERYQVASGLSECSAARQISVLLYTLGQDGEDLLETAALSKTDLKVYDKVVDALTQVFMGKRNVTYERAKFHLRKQKPVEPFDLFLADLIKLVEHCNYGKLKDELVTDRIVGGILDDELSRELQEDGDLNLEKAVQKCRQRESVKYQHNELRSLENNSSTPNPSSSSAVHNVNSSSRKPGKGKPKWSSRPQKPSSQSSNSQRYTKCWGCGRSYHSKSECPAKDVTCNTCQKVGHFAKHCRSELNTNKNKKPFQNSNKSEAEIEICACPVAKASSSARIEEVRSPPSSFIDIFINKDKINVKIDPGADVTAIPDILSSRPSLKPPDRRPYNASGHEMCVTGMFESEVRYNNRSVRDKIYVVPKLKTPLLGKVALFGLDIVRFNLDSVCSAPQSNSVAANYPKLYEGLGTIPGIYLIQQSDNAKPYSVAAPRNIPLPLRKSVREELDRMEKLEVIVKIEEPTDWCAPIVPVKKPDGNLRLCVDFTKLNESIKRPRIILPDVDETLAQIGKSTVFSKLDAQCGFWQIILDESCAKLTTFMTPFGRYYLKRLPFGITSAPEFFQNAMSKLLNGIPNVLCLMDDIFIHGIDQQEHDITLGKVLEKLQSAGVVLNRKKCVFGVSELKYLGHLVNSHGIKPDPDRIKAVREMPAPKNVSQVRSLLGMVNQLGKFIPNLAEKTQPFRRLLEKDVHFEWFVAQVKAFEEIVETICESIELTRYSFNDSHIVMADASAYGIGAVLLADIDGQRKPIMFASRSLSETEQRYAQIEKEALALTWACERFQNFLIGKKFEILTDHKPLVPLLSEKDLNTIPACIQRFRMRLMKFWYSICHIPGKEMFTADVLSRSPLPDTYDEFQEEVEAHVLSIVASFPATPARLDQIRREQGNCEECRLLAKYLYEGWPEFQKDVPLGVSQWFPYRDLITTMDGLLTYDNRIIIPKSLRKDIVSRLHEGHSGLTRTLQRAKESVFWPNITQDIRRVAESCDMCIKNSAEKKLRMLPSSTPLYPWQKIAMDYFEFKGVNYLAVVDYYSRFPEIVEVRSMTVKELIARCKALFARYGIPEIVVSDLGSQFTSEEWNLFASEYGFQKTLSSPLFHQSNGEAERMVQTLKRILQKNADPTVALLNYRASPGLCGKSPAELFFGRRLRTRVPQLQGKLLPYPVDHDAFRQWDATYRSRQAEDYDRRHRVLTKETPLEKGEPVFLPDRQEPAAVTNQVAPRSYAVTTTSGSDLVRNRTMMRPLRSSSGRVIKLVSRLNL